jgi:hypothetical protein
MVKSCWLQQPAQLESQVLRCHPLQVHVSMHAPTHPCTDACTQRSLRRMLVLSWQRSAVVEIHPGHIHPPSLAHVPRRLSKLPYPLLHVHWVGSLALPAVPVLHLRHA